MNPPPTPKQAPPCLHLSGYWIDKAAGRFRCYGCGCQFTESYLAPRRNRRIERWKPSTP